MNDDTSYTSPILWFLAGGAAGAAAALLLAPQAGRDTRVALAKKMSDSADAARGIKDRALKKGGEVWGEAAQRVGDAASVLVHGDGAKPAKTPSL